MVRDLIMLGRWFSRARIKSEGIILCLVIISFFVACRNREAPDPHNWFIQSYNGDIVTVKHAGQLYTTTCEISRRWTNNDTPNSFNVRECRLVEEFIGRNVPAPENTKPDSDGYTLQMVETDGQIVLSKINLDSGIGADDELRIVAKTRGD